MQEREAEESYLAIVVPGFQPTEYTLYNGPSARAEDDRDRVV